MRRAAARRRASRASTERSAVRSPGTFHREGGERIVGSQYPSGKRNIGTMLCVIVINS
ncbi:hypothetical protein BURMUCF2_A1810 [Burkholderia multivorans CF2]|nr:hypothetical protein BURMUCGD1_5366 [Burkholderia multivorans CGD1]EJO53161.1 hypothetical protein BURMUCF2_A1810 [Burkholderia multivorans CF2]